VLVARRLAQRRRRRKPARQVTSAEHHARAVERQLVRRSSADAISAAREDKGAPAEVNALDQHRRARRPLPYWRE